MSTEKLEPPKENNIIPQSIEIKVALLEQSIGFINQTLIRLEKKIDDGFNKTDSNYKWLIRMIVGIYASGFITLLGYFLKH
jgi:hypothetical protein